MTTQPLTSVARYDTLHLGVARHERRLMNEQELVSLLHAHKWSLNKRKRRGQGKLYLYAQQWEGAKRKERYIAPLSRLDRLTPEFVMNKLQPGNEPDVAAATGWFHLDRTGHPVA